MLFRSVKFNLDIEKMASPAFTWELVKRQSSFIVKKHGVCFTKEPHNLTQRNAYKFSGLASAKAVDITLETEKEKKCIVVRAKSAKKCRVTPAASTKLKLNKGWARDANTLKTQVGMGYRQDLRKEVIAKWSAVRRSLYTKAPGAIKSRHSSA